MGDERSHTVFCSFRVVHLNGKAEPGQMHVTEEDEHEG